MGVEKMLYCLSRAGYHKRDKSALMSQFFQKESWFDEVNN